MNATPQRVQSDDPVIEPLGPGPRLRAARERLEMSLHEVGERLHLDVTTVEALEANAYGELPAPTFVRGYLRGYAQLVGLAPDPVVDEFDSQGLAPPALVADISEGPQARTTDLPMRLATWGILAALVVLVVMWWNSQTAGVDIGPGDPEEVVEETGDAATAAAGSSADPGPAPETTGAGADEPGAGAQTSVDAEETDGETVAPRAEAADDMSDDPSGAEGGMTAVSTAAVDEASGEPALEAETGAAAAGEPAFAAADELALDLDAPATGAMPGLDVEPPAALRASAAPSPLEEPAAPASEQRGIDEGAGEPPALGTDRDAGSLALALAPATSDPAAQALAEASVPASADDERLVLRFAAESWVEIYDRDEQRLYFNLVEPDGVIDVAGPGPLRVLLGRAEGVLAAHNGEALDITPYVSRGGIARFTVGGSPTGE